MPLLCHGDSCVSPRLPCLNFEHIGWMHALSRVMETDGGRNQRNHLARLVIVYSGAIYASHNHTLSSRSFLTPTDISQGRPLLNILVWRDSATGLANYRLYINSSRGALLVNVLFDKVRLPTLSLHIFGQRNPH